ncbi:lipase family protein [Glaciecola sp. MF2-115]|uniref:lipase family protein n=1 Tax=Glaciecola sp. MF2-115 TaxID=3384827 RepID=UPI0039A25BC4
MRKKLGIGTHVLAVPSNVPCSIATLFPKELSGSSIEIMGTDGNWSNKETVKYLNNAFGVSGIYSSLPPFSTLKITLKRPIFIDWHTQFTSKSGLTSQELNFKTGFDFNKALYLCQLSNLVYENESIISSTINSHYNFDDYYYYSMASHKKLFRNNFTAQLIAFIRGKRSVIDLQFMYLQKKDEKSGKNLITIVFQGSQEPQDWMTNLSFKDINFLKRGNVHRGFYQGFRLFFQTLRKYSKDANNNIPNTVFDNIDVFNQTSKIILTGHSLGGALATLTSCYLMEQGIKSENIEVYTFGAPPVGAIDYCNYYKEKLAIYRLVNSDDVVPKLEKITNLFHLGKEILLPSNQGEVHACEGYIDNIIDQIESQKV